MTLQVPFLLIVDATQRREDGALASNLELLSQRVVDVARSVGWLPNRIWAGDVTEQELAEAYGKSDAVVILGGEDIDPSLYGGSAEYPEASDHHPLADVQTLALVRNAFVSGMPLFGIGRGMQLINLGLSGGIVPHLENAHVHRAALGEFVSHPVSLVPGTVLHGILGDTIAEVSSSHHQAVGTLAEGLRVSATSPDGVIEAIQHDSAPIFGVQWHPEAGEAEHLEPLLRGLLGLLRAA